MSRKWYQDGDKLTETADGTGCVRVWYDSDTGEYGWERPDGAILKGPEYGPLYLYRLPNGEPASEQWQRMHNPNYRTAGQPVKPCGCCGKDRAPESDAPPCDCEGARCPVGKGRCAKHCDLSGPEGEELTHWHFDKDSIEIPAREIVARPQKETLVEMMRAGVLPWSFAQTHRYYFEEHKPSKVKGALKSTKGIFKGQK
ncbi:hypothetical protein NKR19_g1410 [Coniochaeta hoffmannii]|uniref:Uncharacterized protein n=1 Tax=Coniochaeta hoffmannii TaxID=91930 RepID=A0AA38SIE7_9PEZI|nr:hypothetical protein NKR19_g1410 [Coniochaeta hoffmannii]